MPKRPLEFNKSSAQLPPAKRTKTANESSQVQFSDLPAEILSMIFENLPPELIAQARLVSSSWNNAVTNKYHGPRSSGFNKYLNLFPDNKKNTALTYKSYLKELEINKEPFLEKQFSEIEAIKKNLTDCRGWSNLSHERKAEILKIREKDTNYAEAKRREALLDNIHVEVIRSKINLQSRNLNLNNLNLTRLPKALFTDENLQEFWQTLTQLILSDNQLSTLPTEIGRLQALTQLDLMYNQLTTLPAGIGKLQALTLLFLSHNQLTTLPAEIGSLQTLQVLSLSYNQLTTVPVEIGELQALTWLYLRHNQLTTLPAGIGRLQTLQELSLGHNQLTTLPSEIGSLQGLTDLHLDKNQLTTLPVEIGKLQALQKLYLDHNLFTTLPAEVCELQALIWLILKHNQFTTLPAEIGGLQALTRLDLDGNQLTLETLGQFGQRFGTYWVQETLGTQTRPNLVQKEESSNRNSPRP